MILNSAPAAHDAGYVHMVREHGLVTLSVLSWPAGSIPVTRSTHHRAQAKGKFPSRAFARSDGDRATGAVPARGRRPSEGWSAGQLVTTPLGDATIGGAPFLM